MYGLTDEYKLEFIIKKSKELGITAYEYGQNTQISELGARNILNRVSEKPRTKNLNIMLEYLESKVVGTELKKDFQMHVVKEPLDNYSKEDDLETIIYKRVYEKIKPEIEAQNEKILTLRKDFKRLFEQFIDNKMKQETNQKNKGKSS